MKVAVKDFQIIKSASLEFVPGLTVIQGESNNGKTALFRAIKSCIYNEPGVNSVRLGCNNYLVGIEYNGHKVILQKGANSFYKIDGQQYNKIGKTQVPEVAQALGISALNINDVTEKINFWDQMEKPFLLDRNSSDLFRFIVDSGEDDNINNTLRSMVSDKNKLNTDKNLKEGAINTLKEQIDNMETLLAGFPDKIQLCERIISYGPVTSKLLATTTTITTINTTTATIADTEEEIKKRREIKEAIDKELNTLTYKMSLKAQLADILAKHKQLTDEVATLSTQIANKVDFKAVLPKVEQSFTTKAKLADILDKIATLNDIVVTTPVNKINVLLTPDKVTHLQNLQLMLQRINVLNTQIVNITKATDELTVATKPFIEEYSSIKCCPYCGNMLQHDTHGIVNTDGKEVVAHD